MKLLVTGGCGFIGSAFIEKALYATHEVMNLDALTSASNTKINERFKLKKNYVFEHVDIVDRNGVKRSINDFGPEALVHFAAESHVDKSIIDASLFVQTNIVGT